jgi:hypothetical protein
MKCIAVLTDRMRQFKMHDVIEHHVKQILDSGVLIYVPCYMYDEVYYQMEKQIMKDYHDEEKFKARFGIPIHDFICSRIQQYGIKDDDGMSFYIGSMVCNNEVGLLLCDCYENTIVNEILYSAQIRDVIISTNEASANFILNNLNLIDF